MTKSKEAALEALMREIHAHALLYIKPIIEQKGIVPEEKWQHWDFVQNREYEELHPDYIMGLDGYCSKILDKIEALSQPDTAVLAKAVEGLRRSPDKTDSPWMEGIDTGYNQALDDVLEAIRAPVQTKGDTYCMDCGLPNSVWFAPNKLWNAVIGGAEAIDDPGGICCPNCFVIRAEKSGFVPTAWELRQEFQGEAVVPDGWRDISTAPKDGTEILVGGGDCPYVHVKRFFHRGFPEISKKTYLKGLGDKEQPTHWMPLPAAPTHGEKE